MKAKLFFFLSVLVLIFVFPVNCLVITDGSSDRVYYLGDFNVTVTYIHSVERSEIIEVLEANSSGIFAKEMWWKDFGAGLPEDFQTVENGFYVKRINVFIGRSLDYWFIPSNHAKVYVNGELAFALQGETLLKFRVEKCPLARVIVRRC